MSITGQGQGPATPPAPVGHAAGTYLAPVRTIGGGGGSGEGTPTGMRTPAAGLMCDPECVAPTPHSGPCLRLVSALGRHLDGFRLAGGF